ncbi:MAG: nucleotidyltransferase family protein [Steroidobacteraceae bacterium]
MILAAGRGERMRPLTDHTPKPLLEVGGRRLIEWHLAALARAGFRDVVINHAWLGAQLPATLGDGARYGLRLRYSDEGESALETGGGIQGAALAGSRALPGRQWRCLDRLHHARRPQLDAQALAALVLVPNPPQHPRGDFALRSGPEGTDVVAEPDADAARYTFSGIGVYRPEFFAGCEPGKFPLLPLFRRAAAAGRLRGQLYQGLWFDIGTPQRLRELDERLGAGAVG